MQIVLWNGTDEINIPKLRNQGYLIFLCSEEPYFYAYKKYFRYVNGFITNKGHYAHMGCCEVLVDLPCKLITHNDQEIYCGINAVYCSPDNPEYASLIKKYGKDRVHTTLSDKQTIYNTSTDHPVYEEAIKIIQQYFHNAEIKSEFLS